MTLADQIEALAAKATPGDWVADKDMPYARFPRVHSIDEDGGIVCECGNMILDQDRWEADAALIALLHNHIPTILTALRDTEALRAENARLREAFAAMANTVNIEGSAYDQLIKAADDLVTDIKRQARAALKDTGHE